MTDSNRKPFASFTPTPTGIAALTLDDLQDGIVAESTNSLYVSNILYLLLWLKTNNEEACLTSLCIDIVTRMIAASPPGATLNVVTNANKHSFANVLRRARAEPLIHEDKLKVRVFMRYILHFRKDLGKDNGTTYLGQSSYNHKRSSLFHLFRLHNDKGYTEEYKDQLSNWYKGFSRKIVQLQSSQTLSRRRTAPRKKDKPTEPLNNDDDDDVTIGDAVDDSDIIGIVDDDLNLIQPRTKVDGGKVPMGTDLLMAISKWFLDYGTMDGVFAHTYLLLTWNLACRSHNTSLIKMSDIAWNCSFDSFQVYFSHTKTDQTGEHSRYPRHIFSNPNNCRVCPVFALALYFSCCFGGKKPNVDGFLFPGSKQEVRFGEMLRKVLRDHKDEVMVMGYDVDDLGTHSIRKGASTYLTSLPGGPSVAAICLRGGWSMGHIKDRYFKYFDSGDQFVGRCLALLNIHSSSFACSPAFFNVIEGSKDDCEVNRIVGLQFPVMSKVVGFGRICRMCLGSMYYNLQWIRDNLHLNHIIKNTSQLIKNHAIISKLEIIEVKVTYPWNDKDHVFAGIPPHVSMMQDLTMIRDEQRLFVDNFVDKVKEAIDACAPGAIRITEERLKKILNDFTTETCIQFDRIDKKLASKEIGTNDNIIASVGDEPVNNTDKEKRPKFRAHFYGGGIHRVPVGYRLPRCSTRDLWRQWWLGDDEIQVPPLKILTAKDVNHLDAIPISEDEKHRRTGKYKDNRRRSTKTLCDIRFLMNYVESLVKEVGALTNIITVNNVEAMFDSVVYRLDVASSRDCQKQWASVVRALRRRK
jgi:hypothetical protein